MRKLIVFIYIVVTASIFTFLSFRPEFFWIILSFTPLIVIIVTAILIGRSFNDFIKTIPPIIFITSVQLFIIFTHLVRWQEIGVFIFALILLGFYVSQWFDFPTSIRLKGAHFSFFDVMSLAIIFFVLVNLFNLSSSFGISLYVVMLGVILLGFVMIFFNLWASELPPGIGFFYGLLFSVILFEIFIVLSFWSIDPLAKSLLLSVIYYTYWGFLKLRLGRSFYFYKIIPYIVIATAVFAFVLKTVTWVPYY